MRIDPYAMAEYCIDATFECSLFAAIFWIVAAMFCIMLCLLMMAVWILVNPLVFALSLGRVQWFPRWMS